MIDAGAWIQGNADILIQATTEALSNNRAIQSQVSEAVDGFYRALLRAIVTFDPTPLYTVLFDWVEARTGPIDQDSASLMPVLARIKRAIAEQVIHHCEPEDAVRVLLTIDRVMTDALVFLAQVETETLMAATRAQVQAAQLELEQVNKTKTDFIAIAAHELKTPLTVVEGYTSMMQSYARESSDDLLNTYVEGIEKGMGRLHELIDDVVDVSLLDLGMFDLHFQPVLLHPLLDSIQYMVNDHVLTEREITFTVDRESIPRYPTIGDPGQLLKVLEKVIMNALKYTPDGGNVLVYARDFPGFGFIDLMVEDSGIGIDPANLTRIFNAFSGVGDANLHSSGKVKFKGAGPGLGLPIAKGIIEAHGGTIWAESAGYNEETCPGSTFHIMIPMHS